MIDVSVVIPSRNEDAMLWATVVSAHESLQAARVSYEIIPVVNGPSPQIAALMHRAKLAKVYCSDASSPQAARHVGAIAAKGCWLFFLDAHCIVPQNFFLEMLNTLDRSGATLLHSPHRFLGKTFYGFTVDWDGTLWAKDTIDVPPTDQRSFEIAVAGHGAIGMLRHVYWKTGGYWQALRGFGGEETQLNLKMWLLGKRCAMATRTHHWHWLPPQGRHDESMFRDPDFIRNHLMIAEAYGGSDQLRRTRDALEIKGGISIPLPCFDVNTLAACMDETLAAGCVGRNGIACLRKQFEHEKVVH